MQINSKLAPMPERTIQSSQQDLGEGLQDAAVQYISSRNADCCATGCLEKTCTCLLQIPIPVFMYQLQRILEAEFDWWGTLRESASDNRVTDLLDVSANSIHRRCYKRIKIHGTPALRNFLMHY